MPSWYSFQAKAADAVDVLLFDAIGGWDPGEGITARAFVDELAKLPENVRTIRVRINSPGGDVFAALAIANALRAEREGGRRVETIVDGLAASAASLVLMAGEPARIADGGLIMIHNPWSWAIGTAAEMRGTAEALDKIRGACVATYLWKSKLSAEEIGALMDAETWLEADEARAKGLVDEVIEGAQASAGTFHPRALARLKVPEKYAARFAARAPEASRPAPPAPAPKGAADVAQVVKLCARAHVGMAFAQGLIAEGLSMADVKARVAAEVARLGEVRAHADTIRALCKAARAPELADEFIRGEARIENVRRILLTVSAKADHIEIDNILAPAAPGRGGPKVLDVAATYAERKTKAGR